MIPANANDPIIRLLADSELFRNLTTEDLATCAAKFRKIEFAKGEKLFQRGDPGTSLYLISQGQVRLAVTTSEGRELSFMIAGAGDLFGEIAVFDGWPRSAEATALTVTSAYGLERNDFHRLRSIHPAISDAVISFLCRRLREVNERFETVALHPIDVRLARFLLAALGDTQAPAGRRVPLELKISQTELAILLGASRTKINAALGTLENAGAIGRTSDRLFCDRAKLELIAQRADAQSISDSR
jgi:CRP/FNR family transcriptional regulator, cyclic AMP receptor protein